MHCTWISNKNSSFCRHWCDQNDQLKYQWTYHDGNLFGIEDIHDRHFQINIQWLKQFTGKHGGDWTARIHLIPQVNICYRVSNNDRFFFVLSSQLIEPFRFPYSSIFIINFLGLKKSIPFLNEHRI